VLRMSFELTNERRAMRKRRRRTRRKDIILEQPKIRQGDY